MNIIKMEFDLNGTVVDDIQSWKDGAVTYGKAVKFVGKTSFAPMTGRYSFQIKYAQPQKGRIDFTQVIYEEGMTFTVYLDGGETITYRDIHLTEVSESEGGDGENELAYTYTFMAADRDPK